LVGRDALKAFTIVAKSRPRIFPGAAAMRVPTAAPPMMTSSAGWMRTWNGPPAMAKPPSTAAKTTRRPMIVNMRVYGRAGGAGQRIDPRLGA
jgi:hypothetical protein